MTKLICKNNNRGGIYVKNKKGFSLIELIVVIAIIGIVVMLATPKFLSYVEKAELARIQHDVKIMEDKMAEDSINGVKDFATWDDNAKDLGLLVLADLLYETEGKAKNVAKPRTQYGDVASSGDVLSEVKVSSDYKVMPEFMSKKIKTELPGTFYTNVDGKVYYEHDKPLTRTNIQNKIECIAPTPEEGNYEFEPSTGTIIKYNGNLQHLVIPASFNVDGVCYPVRIIGRGAFMQGNYKQIIIPEGVVKIEDEAFYDVELETIIIPSSVTDIRDEIFKDSIVNNIIINSSKNNVTVGDKVNSGGYRSPGYSPGDGGSDGTNDGSSDSVDTIVTSSGIGYGGGYVGSGKGTIGSSGIASMKGFPSINISNGSGGSSGGNKTSTSNNGNVGNLHFDVVEHTFVGSSGGSGNKGIIVKDNIGFNNGVVVIPPTISVDGEDIPIISIDKGVYQGKGLISVVMPEGLERIEDYAFAGNQLIGVVIPSSVNYIGNYAFAYNELTDGRSYKPTIKSINIKNNEYIDNLDKRGNIIKDFSDIELNDYIFLTSLNNFKIVIDRNNETENSKYSNSKIKSLISEGYIPISNFEDLNSIRNNQPRVFAADYEDFRTESFGGFDKKYIQIVDIDLSHVGSFNPLGEMFSNYFTGTYNGGNFEIRNLRINKDDGYVGLFRRTKGATMENIGLVDAYVKGRYAVGALIGTSDGGVIRNSYSIGEVIAITDSAGGLIGNNTGSTIENSYANVKVSSGGVGAGGLVARNFGGNIIDSYASGTVSARYHSIGGLVGGIYDNSIVINSYATTSVLSGERYLGGLVGNNESSSIIASYASGSVSGQYFIGGLAGANDGKSTIIDSYSTGTVRGRENIGGLVGDSSGTIKNSYTAGTSTGNRYVGGLAGRLYNGIVKNSIYKVDTSNQLKPVGTGIAEGILGIESTKMKDKGIVKSTYPDWNFDIIWQIDPSINDGYPSLQWQNK